jgi:hypothetical protein
MTNLPLAIALIPLLLFLILFAIFSIFNLFHIIHYGASSFGKFLIIAVYVAGTVFLIGSGFITLNKYDWKRPISVSDFFNQEQAQSLFELPDVPLRDLNSDL